MQAHLPWSPRLSYHICKIGKTQEVDGDVPTGHKWTEEAKQRVQNEQHD